jgi:hypothetical protein
MANLKGKVVEEKMSSLLPRAFDSSFL